MEPDFTGFYAKFEGTDAAREAAKTEICSVLNDPAYDIRQFAEDHFDDSNTAFCLDEDVSGVRFEEAAEEIVKKLIGIPNLRFEFELLKIGSEIHDIKYIAAGTKRYLLCFDRKEAPIYRFYLLDKDLNRKKIERNEITEFQCGEYYDSFEEYFQGEYEDVVFPIYVYLKKY